MIYCNPQSTVGLLGGDWRPSCEAWRVIKVCWVFDLKSSVSFCHPPTNTTNIYQIFLYHVNQCRVQLGTNKVVVVVVVAASIHYRHYTHG